MEKAVIGFSEAVIEKLKSEIEKIEDSFTEKPSTENVSKEGKCNGLKYTIQLLERINNVKKDRLIKEL